MLIYTLAISSLIMSNLSWFMDFIFQVPWQYCSYRVRLTFHYQTPPQLNIVSAWLSYFILSAAIHNCTVFFPSSIRSSNPDSSVGKESACNAGEPSSTPGLGRSSEEGIGYPLQYSWAFLVAQWVKNLPAMETWVWSLGWEDPLEEGMAININILA